MKNRFISNPEFGVTGILNHSLALIQVVFIILLLSSCDKKPQQYHRPLDPWAFRSVLDKQPRMLTVALDSSCYAAYDLARCTLYKVWKGGVMMEGAPYTNVKNVQPTTWGKSYFSDSLHLSKWVAEVDGKESYPQVVSKGYAFHRNQISLRFNLLLATGDTIHIEERPEFIQREDGKPGLERVFKTSAVPHNIRISLISSDSTFTLNANKTTRVVTYYSSLPRQVPPKPGVEYDHRGLYWMEKSDCMTCHEVDKKTVGPSFIEIAQRYPNDKASIEYLINKVKEGGTGAWGGVAMNAHPGLTEREIKEMLNYIFSLKPKEEKTGSETVKDKKAEVIKRNKPGYGAPLEGVHPSYTVTTIHDKNFKPRVGGLAFRPDGRLLVTTWDVTGGVYLLDGVETGDTSKITVKRIASGLAEPLGIEVVDGEIYVLQKQELTKLIDDDGAITGC